MNAWRLRCVVGLVLCAWHIALLHAAENENPLPSWRDGKARCAIIAFVDRVTDKASPDFVPVPERIATFDNDGTLWSEKPYYSQLLFALDRVRALAPAHPEWKTQEPFKSVLAGDMQGVLATGKQGLDMILVASHANVTAETFREAVETWLSDARHPTSGKRYTEMVYLPMLELLAYLREHDFKIFIVSGGGIDFMRCFAEDVYRVPPEQVIGTTTDAKYQMRGGVPTIVKTGTLVLFDDKQGKPVAIYRHIGRRPIFAAGNSDGDLQMLEYATVPRDSNDRRPRLGLIVHHTDAEREWAYDRKSLVGRLDKALQEAPRRGWIVVDMKHDWKQVFPDGRQ